MLRLEGVVTRYGRITALAEVSLAVGAGEFVCLIGANGAGKTTTLKTISGLLRPASGRILLDGDEIQGRPPQEILRRGVAHCPEGRRVFPYMTVTENLAMGAYARQDTRAIAADLDRVLAHFPILAERRRQAAGTLSGGEQQMLAISRALMSRPRLLLLDEPSLGLAPLLAKQIFSAIRELNERDRLTVFLVEQNAYRALKLAHRGYVIVNGLITLTGSGRELLERPEVRAAYLEAGRH